MISQFFVLSPRGDTILAKQYRSASGIGAHERSHTEAFFRKIKFWDDQAESPEQQQAAEQAEPNGGGGSGGGGGEEHKEKQTGDAPPVFKMPDGQTYFNVRRNGLIFAASSQRNVSPNTVLEVSRTCSITRIGFLWRHSLLFGVSHESNTNPFNFHHPVPVPFSYSLPLRGYSRIIVGPSRRKHCGRILSCVTNC